MQSKHANDKKVYKTNSTRNVTYASSRVYTGNHKTVHPYTTSNFCTTYPTTHTIYRTPTYVNIIWTPNMHTHYIKMYPSARNINYRYGNRIEQISANKAEYFIGEVKNVYGMVTEIYYSQQSDEYFLYMGAYYPYQSFTVVVPGNIARKQSYRPGNYYLNQHLNVTGLLTAFDGKPEIVVKASNQLNLY
jgi:hypothetical protein